MIKLVVNCVINSLFKVHLGDINNIVTITKREF